MLVTQDPTADVQRRCRKRASVSQGREPRSALWPRKTPRARGGGVATCSFDPSSRKPTPWRRLSGIQLQGPGSRVPRVRDDGYHWKVAIIMISKFVTVYAGHIDLPDMGQDDDAGQRAALLQRAARRRVREDRGHRQEDGCAAATTRCGWPSTTSSTKATRCMPNILMLAVHLAHVTKRLRIGCGFNIAPMWHPLRLAEDFAVADILTKGRTIFGVGRGYHTREVETFGAPMLDQNANRELFEEQVEIIFKAFNQELFSHKGKHYTLPPEVPYRGYQLKELTLVPRPVNMPVECWQPIVSASRARPRLHGASTASRARSAAAPRRWRRGRSRPIATPRRARARTGSSART